jgi:hypothetical protein
MTNLFAAQIPRSMEMATAGVARVAVLTAVSSLSRIPLVRPYYMVTS